MNIKYDKMNEWTYERMNEWNMMMNERMNENMLMIEWIYDDDEWMNE